MESSTTDTASSSQEALAAFFTPARREYYRELHHRYPLWCGDWYEPEISKPDGDRWLLETRLREVAQRFVPRDRLVRVDFSEKPTSDRVPLPNLTVVPSDGGNPESLRAVPTAACALLAAISYTYARWTGGSQAYPEIWADPAYSPLDLRKTWSMALHIQLAVPEGHPVTQDFGPDGRSLAILRRRFLNPQDDEAREQRREDLYRYWNQIGQAVGILPAVPGGPKCTLTRSTVRQLVREGEDLVEAVTGYEPDDRERDIVRELLPWRRLDVPGTFSDFERRYPKEAKEKKRAWDPELGTDDWSRRLRFPMLRSSELSLVRDEWEGGQKRRTRHRRLAVEFLLADNRLPIGVSQINRLAKARK